MRLAKVFPFLVGRPTGIALALALLLAGCGDEDLGAGACEQERDCPSAHFCVDGRCRRACNTSAECDRGQRCQGGMCLPRPAVDARSPGADGDDARDAASGDTTLADGAGSDRAHDAATDRAEPADAGQADAATADSGGDASASDAHQDSAVGQDRRQDSAAAPDLVADTTRPDSTAERGQIPDSGTDAGRDAATTDTAVPDTATPDTATPDTTTPDAAAPDAAVTTAWSALGASALISGDWGGLSASPGASVSPAIGRDQSNQLVVAWADSSSGNFEIYARQYVAQRWQEMGLASASGNGISSNPGDSVTPAIAAGTGFGTVVAWADSTSGNFEIYVRAFNGVSWQPLGSSSASGGGVSQTGGASQSPTLVLDATGALVVAWEEAVGGQSEIYARRYTGETWGFVGGDSATGGGVSQSPGPSHWPRLLARQDGSLALAWMDGAPSQIFVKELRGGLWQAISNGSASGGGVSNASGNAMFPCLAAGAESGLYLAWLEHASSAYVARVKVFRGIWQDLNGEAAARDDSAQLLPSHGPSLVAYATEPVSLAWVGNAAGNDEIYALSLVGDQWLELGPGAAAGGGVSQRAGASVQPAMIPLGAGSLALAWADDTSGTFEIYASSFDGKVWHGHGEGSRLRGGVSLSDGRSTRPSLALGAAGRPIVVWADDTPGVSAIYARAYSGVDWQELGPSSATGMGVSSFSASASSPALAMNRVGDPMVAWTERTVDGRSYIFVRYYVAGSWHEMAGSASGSGISTFSNSNDEPALALDAAGLPVVSWTVAENEGSNIYAVRFTGETWQKVGAIYSGAVSQTAEASWGSTLVAHPDGKITVAWVEGTGLGADIYVRQFEGPIARELGGGSASGDGVSQSPGTSRAPTLAVDGAGQVILAWQDNSTSTEQIYARRFSGGLWRDLGFASATGTGVSASASGATSPRLAVGPAGEPLLAWIDHDDASPRAVVKRFVSDSWHLLGVQPDLALGGAPNLSATTEIALTAAGHRACLAWQLDGISSSEILLRCLDDL